MNGKIGELVHLSEAQLSDEIKAKLKEIVPEYISMESRNKE